MPFLYPILDKRNPAGKEKNEKGYEKSKLHQNRFCIRHFENIFQPGNQAIHQNGNKSPKKK